jgi:hypothetical protein
MVQFLQPLMLALPSLYLAMRMSKVSLGHRCGLLPSIFCHWPSFRLFGLIILAGHSSPMTTSLPLVDLSIELDHVHVCWQRVLVELHLGIFYKFQSSIVYGQLNLSTKNIAIISSMRIRIMSFTICMLFDLFYQWYDMTTW